MVKFNGKCHIGYHGNITSHRVGSCGRQWLIVQFVTVMGISGNMLNIS